MVKQLLMRVILVELIILLENHKFTHTSTQRTWKKHFYFIWEQRSLKQSGPKTGQTINKNNSNHLQIIMGYY